MTRVNEAILDQSKHIFISIVHQSKQGTCRRPYPLLTQACSSGNCSEAGPMVAMIFVRLLRDSIKEGI